MSKGQRRQPPTQPKPAAESPDTEPKDVSLGGSPSLVAERAGDGVPEVPPAMAPPSKVRLPVGVFVLLVFAFALIVIRNAWMSDDAYITLRVVDNFIHGHGLRWNVDERVQAYTHPLWMILLAIAHFVTREGYYSTLALSVLLSVATAIVFARGTVRRASAIVVGLTVLTLSKAFVDYSTSGLENPLTHLLLAIYWTTYARAETSQRYLFRLSLIAGLATLNRLDTLVLFAPSLFCFYWRFPKLSGLRTVALGFLPLAVWEAFSLFYYGFLFPNTAYAKLNTGIGSLALIRNGGYYLLDSFSRDPLTALVIGAALLATAVSRKRRQAPLAVGILLYLLYVVRIGGDFMSGRFLSAPLLASVLLLAELDLYVSRAQACLAGIVIVIVGASSTFSPLRSGSDYKQVAIDNGIADERGYYYPYTGLLRARSGEPWPHNWEVAKLPEALLKEARKTHVLVWPAVGILGYDAGAGIHIVDGWALADAFLARLPAAYSPQWRVGHYQRALPAGYVETLVSGRNRLKDLRLAEYYRALSTIVRGPLFSASRFVAVWKMNTGQYDKLIDRTALRFAGQLKAKVADLGEPKEEGTAWNAPGVHVMPDSGIAVDLGRRCDARVVDVSLDGNDSYRIVYRLQGNDVAEQEVRPRLLKVIGLDVYRLDVPGKVVQGGYDEIWVVPVQGDGAYSLGHLRLSSS